MKAGGVAARGQGELIDEFKRRHPSIKTGKGSLNLRLTDELPEADVRDTIRRALEGA